MSEALELEPVLSGSQERPRLASSVPFVLGWVRSWEFVVDRVLPELRRYPLRGGINGVEDAHIQRDGDRVSYARAVDHVARRFSRGGHVILPHNRGPDGHGYNVPHEVQGGIAHLPPWEAPFARSTKVKVDAEEFGRWVDWWVSEGLIDAAPSPDVVEANLNAIRIDIQRRRAKPGGLDDHTLSRLKARERAWERFLAPPKAAAKPKRKAADLGADPSPGDPSPNPSPSGDTFGD